jgi:hypothetical protein
LSWPSTRRASAPPGPVTFLSSLTKPLQDGSLAHAVTSTWIVALSPFAFPPNSPAWLLNSTWTIPPGWAPPSRLNCLVFPQEPLCFHSVHILVLALTIGLWFICLPVSPVPLTAPWQQPKLLSNE